MHAPPIQHYRQYEIRGDRPDQREAEKRPAAIALLHHEVFIAAQSHLRGKLEEMRAGRDEDERGEPEGDEPHSTERQAPSPPLPASPKTHGRQLSNGRAACRERGWHTV